MSNDNFRFANDEPYRPPSKAKAEDEMRAGGNMQSESLSAVSKPMRLSHRRGKHWLRFQPGVICKSRSG